MTKTGKEKGEYRRKAIRLYWDFLHLLDYGVQGIYSREDALARLKKLAPAKKAILETMEGATRSLEELMGVGE
jgi:hypothetical protein